MMTHEADVDTGDTTATEVPCAGDHLVYELRSVCLKTKHHLEVVSPTLCVLASRALDGNIGTAVVDHFPELACYRLALAERGEVNGLDVRVGLLDEVQSPVLVNHDDLLCTVQQREFCCHLSNRSSTPDGDDIILLDTGVDNSVPRCTEHVGKEETLLIGNIIWKGKEVDVAVGNTSVLRLTTGETTCEVRVAEHACRAATVHCVLDCVVVGLLALRGELLLAVEAVTASNLERRDHALAVMSVSTIRRL